MKEMDKNWHLALFKKSILKQAKLKAIIRYLPPCNEKTCVDLGGDNGVLSYYLRRCGGEWYSLDLEDRAIESIRAIVETNVYKVNNESLPFNDSFFDIAVIIDLLEHTHNDKELVRELGRVLKKDASLIINVPYIKRFSLIRLIRNIVGLTDERHGHVRHGYTKDDLRKILEPYFSLKKQRTYSRFFTELLDIFISLPQLKKERGTKGVLITERDLKKNMKLFKFYTIIYPFLWLFSRLDLLLFFTRGHSLIVLCEPKA